MTNPPTNPPQQEEREALRSLVIPTAGIAKAWDQTDQKSDDAIDAILAWAAQREHRLVVEAVKKAELKARLSQTRKIYQHDKDVWGASRNKGYFEAEIDRLKAHLASDPTGKGGEG